MATIGSKVTLLDVAKSFDPDGKAAAVAEMLSQENEMLLDMPWIEGNLPTGHRITMRTGLPDVVFRKLNTGVPSSKATQTQVDEATAILEARSEIDCDLADLNGNTSSFRLSQAKAFIEAMNQQMQKQVIYGDRIKVEGFVGLQQRFNSVSGSAENKANVIDAGGTGSNNTSVYLVGWGKDTVSGIYPKGSMAGLKHNDLGIIDAFDGDQNRFRAYGDQYQWKCGIQVSDWRYVVRIANIDVNTLTKNAATGADLIDQMTIALERIHSLTGVTPSFYCNRTIRSFLRRQTVSKVASGTLEYDEVAGKKILTFGEVPVRRIDALVNNEPRVV